MAPTCLAVYTGFATPKKNPKTLVHNTHHTTHITHLQYSPHTTQTQNSHYTKSLNPHSSHVQIRWSTRATCHSVLLCVCGGMLEWALWWRMRGRCSWTRRRRLCMVGVCVCMCVFACVCVSSIYVKCFCVRVCVRIREEKKRKFLELNLNSWNWTLPIRWWE